MKRHVLLGAIGAAAGSPSILRAQAKPVIGYLSGRSLATDGHLLTAVREGLKEAGYVDGQNVTMDFRWAEGRFERLEALAVDLVKAKPNIIIAVGGHPRPSRRQGCNVHDPDRLHDRFRSGRTGGSSTISAVPAVT